MYYSLDSLSTEATLTTITTNKDNESHLNRVYTQEDEDRWQMIVEDFWASGSKDNNILNSNYPL